MMEIKQSFSISQNNSTSSLKDKEKIIIFHCHSVLQEDGNLCKTIRGVLSEIPCEPSNFEINFL
jgi:hypothetical protein